jgi:hypothetical protein
MLPFSNLLRTLSSCIRLMDRRYKMILMRIKILKLSKLIRYNRVDFLQFYNNIKIPSNLNIQRILSVKSKS